ncbi:uncharacterized protein LOC141660716 [Apium graveolens]|uniref:uncharacterized protein LOC141660716 n=1 Tax=Apium graveolens TaxID=4045 RepID=UPI003D7BE85B
MTKSNKEQLIVHCRAEGCNWRMRPAFMHNSGYWRINVNIEEHRCMVDQPLQDHKKLSARMISMIVKPLVIDTPEIPIKTIIPLINNEHNHILGYKKAWRGKQIAIEGVYGRTGHVHLQVNLLVFEGNDGRWQHAHPVISIDGTFLKGRYRGKLLVSMGVDSNNHPFTLCYYLVDEEMYETWSWFLQRIRRHVCRQKIGVCIISDRAASILSAVRDPQNGFAEPLGIHRFCLLHDA